MIDHMKLLVSDVERSKLFYDAELESLRYRCIATEATAIGYDGNCWQFSIEKAPQRIAPLHIAFQAVSKAQVDEFFSTAIDNGASSNGEPGYRPRYGAGYYAAFVHDSDDHSIDAVFRGDG